MEPSIIITLFIGAFAGSAACYFYMKRKSADLEEGFTQAFKSLSAEALRENNQHFFELAKQSFENLQDKAKEDLKHRQEKIDQTVSPIKDVLDKFDQQVTNLEKSRQVAYTQLQEQVKNLLSSHNKLESETSNLVKALRTPHVRGQWGEMQLKRTVELAGMTDHVDFYEQTSVNTEDGRLRPDMIVKLPNEKELVVDAKAPLSAYLDYIQEKSPEHQEAALKEHARLIRDHVQKLSAKAYWKQFERAPEFVVLFLPGETFFSAALQADPSLIEFGVTQKVIVATPTTLIALFKTVAHGWREEAIAQETREIRDLGATLYERVRVLATHFDDMRKGIERTAGSYNKAVASLESRVLPTARKLGELNSMAEKEIHALEDADAKLTTMKAEELVEQTAEKISA